MAIAYVGGAVNNGSTGGSSISVTVNYTPTAGNLIVVGFALSSSSTAGTATCVDNNSNALTLNADTPFPFITAGQFYGVAVAGATSFTVSINGISGSTMAVVLAEYSGGGTEANTGSTNTGSSTTQTISITTTGNNSFIIATLSTRNTNTFSSSTGHLRQQETAPSGCSISLVDNTAASSGTSVTCATFQSFGGTFQAIAFELLLPVVASNHNFLAMMGCGT